MSVLTQQIQSAITSHNVNPDGDSNITLDVPGHDVQIAAHDGSRWFTVFVDGEAAELQKGQIEGWIEARLK